MDILGIGPGEFLLILVLLLVVVGPERLPDLARQGGRLLVRVRNWVQRSPDAAMVMRARQEIEAELANLRTSLLEVQSVRDEMLDVARQVEESVESLTSATKSELDQLGTIAPPSPPAAAPAGTADLPPDAPLTPPEPAPALGNGSSPALQAAVEQAMASHAPPEVPPTPAVAAGDLATIELRLQAIMSDLFALQTQLKQRGALADDWVPPSWQLQIPAPTAATSADVPEPQSDAVEQGGSA